MKAFAPSRFAAPAVTTFAPVCESLHRKRTVIAFEVDAKTVSILGIFYGGRDYESVFRSDPDSDHE